MKKRAIKNKRALLKKDLGEKRKNKTKVGKWLYWSPRILSILFILFLSLFSLDIFESCNSFSECALALFMHNIPSIVLIIFLVIAWKWEWVGALGFILAGLLYVFLTLFRNEFQWYYLAWSLQIALPAFIIGYLWWLNWKRKR